MNKEIDFFGDLKTRLTQPYITAKNFFKESFDDVIEDTVKLSGMVFYFYQYSSIKIYIGAYFGGAAGLVAGFMAIPIYFLLNAIGDSLGDLIEKDRDEALIYKPKNFIERVTSDLVEDLYKLGCYSGVLIEGKVIDSVAEMVTHKIDEYPQDIPNLKFFLNLIVKIYAYTEPVKLYNYCNEYGDMYGDDFVRQIFGELENKIE